MDLAEAHCTALSAAPAGCSAVSFGHTSISVQRSKPDSTPVSTVVVHMTRTGVVICADTLHLTVGTWGQVERAEIDKAVVTERFALGYAGTASITVRGDGAADRLDVHALLAEYTARAADVAEFVAQLRADARTVLRPFLSHAAAQLELSGLAAGPVIDVLAVAVMDRDTSEYCIVAVRGDGSVGYELDRVRAGSSDVVTVVLGHHPGHGAPGSANLDVLRRHGLEVVRRAARSAPHLSGIPTVGGEGRWWRCERHCVSTGDVPLDS